MANHDDVASNPWPGYVDALSTIIMVFIFLVILLGIVITALSQNVARQMAEAKSEAQQAKQALQELKDLQDRGVTLPPDDNKDGQPGAASAGASAKAATTEGSLAGATAKAVSSDEKQTGRDQVSVLAKKVDDPSKVAVVAGEKSDSDRKVRIDTSTAALTLVFESGVRISQAASDEVRAYFDGHPDFARDSRIEIIAFASALGGGSISEARRTAYYRALLVRNEMMAHGFTGDRIKLQVSVSARPDDKDRVRIFAR